eukprot:1183650-Prorocentrum_minimum.AAC.2
MLLKISIWDAGGGRTVSACVRVRAVTRASSPRPWRLRATYPRHARAAAAARRRPSRRCVALRCDRK